MTGGPVFYQFITRTVLEKVIKIQLPVNSYLTPADSRSSLDFEEANALQCTGGYLLRALKLPNRQTH